MIGEQPTSFQEFMAKEPLRLAVLHDAVLEFLLGRDDMALGGADAVNAYVREKRLCEDVDVLALGGSDLAEGLCAYIADRFGIEVRGREARVGQKYCLDHVRASGSRHLVDVWPVQELPPTQSVRGFRVVAPEELIAGKVRAFVSRQGKPKSGIDMRDLAMLLLRFPELKTETRVVRDCLLAAGAGPEVFAAWSEIVVQDIQPEGEDDKFSWCAGGTDDA